MYYKTVFGNGNKIPTGKVNTDLFTQLSRDYAYLISRDCLTTSDGQITVDLTKKDTVEETFFFMAVEDVLDRDYCEAVRMDGLSYLQEQIDKCRNLGTDTALWLVRSFFAKLRSGFFE